MEKGRVINLEDENEVLTEKEIKAVRKYKNKKQDRMIRKSDMRVK